MASPRALRAVALRRAPREGVRACRQEHGRGGILPAPELGHSTRNGAGCKRYGEAML